METITGKLKKSEQIVSWRIYPPVHVHFSSNFLKDINQGTMNDPYSFKPHNSRVSNQISNQWSSAEINIKMATWEDTSISTEPKNSLPVKRNGNENKPMLPRSRNGE